MLVAEVACRSTTNVFTPLCARGNAPDPTVPGLRPHASALGADDAPRAVATTPATHTNTATTTGHTGRKLRIIISSNQRRTEAR